MAVAVVETARVGGSRCELEARVGTRGADGSFRPGISSAVHDALVDVLDGYSGWAAAGTDVERQDLFFKQGRLR